MSKILVLIPIKPGLNKQLRDRAYLLASRIPGANPEHDVTIAFGCAKEPKLPGDNTAWSKVGRVRNKIIWGFALGNFDYVCWIDADVVGYDADIVGKLISANPNGASGPMIFVEGTTRFYDWAAAVMEGKSNINPEFPGLDLRRQLGQEAPYWPSKPLFDVMPMDCIGTFYTVPVAPYLAYVEHTDHPSFTDHWSICKWLRDNGRPVTIHRGLSVTHANLPNYSGENWH